MTQKEFEKQFAKLIEDIQKQATPFTSDSTEKKLARVKRAKVDKFFFATSYFPHYVETRPEYRECWKTPDKNIDWVHAGFAPFHYGQFKLADLLGLFTIDAGFRESAKDTLLGKIDVLHKLLFEDRWFIPIIARTETKAETKVVPIKVELESNLRLLSDFGPMVGGIEWEFGSIILKNGRKVKGYGREQSLVGEENFGHRPDQIMYNDVSDPNLKDSIAIVNANVKKIKESDLKAVNSPRWSALMLCNYTIKNDIIDELMTGKNTEHFNKIIVRKLVENVQETKEDKLIARQCREAGYSDKYKSAWEFRHPTLAALKEQKEDPETFDCQMMMRPRSPKDQKFKDTYFRYHSREDIRSRKYVYYTAVDPSGTDSNDNKAVITVGLGLNGKGELHIPIMKADIQQESIDWMLETSWLHHKLFAMNLLGVEDNSYKDFVEREYVRLMAKKKTPLPFLRLPHHTSKPMRIEHLIPFIKMATITFDQDDPDQDLLIRQLKAFPNGGNVKDGGLGDDGPDALAMCLELIEVYPHSGKTEYESITKRTAVFDRGTW